MNIPVGSTGKVSIGPFSVGSGTPTFSLRVNGNTQAAAGSGSAVGSDHHCSYTPNAADTAAPGQLKIIAQLPSGETVAVELQVGDIAVVEHGAPIGSFTLTLTSGSDGNGYAGSWSPGGTHNGQPYWIKGALFAFGNGDGTFGLGSSLTGPFVNTPTSSNGINFSDFFGSTWTASPGLATIQRGILSAGAAAVASVTQPLNINNETLVLRS